MARGNHTKLETKQRRWKPYTISGLATHGLHGIDSTKSWRSAANLMWMCLFLVCLAGFLYHGSLLLQSYWEYNRIANIEVKTADVKDFPAVTLCSLNPFKKSKIHLVKAVNNLQAAYNYATQKIKSGLTAETQRKRRDTRVAKVQKITEKQHSVKKRLISSRNFTELSRMKRQESGTGAAAVEDYVWQYDGCFEGSNGVYRILMGKYTYNDTYRMMYVDTGVPTSVDSCLSFCRGHRFAGIQYGYGCMCGDEKKFSAEPVSDSLCDMPCEDTSAVQTTCAQFGCPANCGSNQCCGSATSWISIYEATVFPIAGEFVACIAEGQGLERVAYDKNTWGEQIIPTTVIDTTSLAYTDININTCMDYCRGYHYMGIHGAMFCACALGPDSLQAQHTALDPGMCNLTCYGGGLKTECAHFGCDRPGCLGEGQCCGGLYGLMDEQYYQLGVVAVHKIHGCHLPSLVGAALYSTPADFAFVGETIEFACEGGYSIDPATDATWLCNSSKQLELAPEPTCRPDCVFTDHTIPLGHALTSESAIPFGSTVLFECTDPYPYLLEMQGESVIECLAGGVWSHPAPVCAEAVITKDSLLPVEFDIAQLKPEQEEVYQWAVKEYEMELESITAPVSYHLQTLNQQAQAAVQDIVRNTPESELWEITFGADELFPFCRFNRKNCDSGAIKSLPHPIYGRCHELTNSEASAPKSGQRSVLQTAIWNEPEDELLTTESRGGRLILHEQKDYPFPEINGVSVASGFRYIISFSKQVINHLPGTCHGKDNSFESIYPPEYDYSEKICFRTCAAKHVYATCNCTDTRFPYPEEAVDAASCKARDDCYQKAMLHSVRACDMCRQKCRMVKYPLSVSVSAWPLENSFQHMNDLCTDPTNTTLCRAQIGNNAMLLYIRPSLAQYEEITEALATTMGQLFNDASNAVGIWIGLSYLGLWEIAFVIDTALVKLWLRIKRFACG